MYNSFSTKSRKKIPESENYSVKCIIHLAQKVAKKILSLRIIA